MHILYIHQYFATPKGTSGTRSYEFARRWINAGHKVTVITGHYDIGGLKPEKGLIQKQTIDRINVIIVGTKYSHQQSFFKRLMSFSYFTVLSIYVGLKQRGVDAIYATSTPLTVGISAMVLKWFKQIPFVFEVRDQWPAIPVEMSIIKNKVLIKILFWLERKIYKSSTAIVALSPGMADGVRSVLKEEKTIAIIPNGCDTDVFRPDINGSKIRQERGWDDKLVLLHFGAIGKANGLEFVIDAAERLKSNTNIHFVLVGDGGEKPSLVKRIAQSSLKNVEFLDSVPKTELPRIIAACDVSMVIFANYSILQHNSANKFFDSLSAGKPVLLNYSGWQRDILEENQAGLGCNLCDLDEFVERVLYFNSHREQLIKMGQNARLIAEKKFSRDKLAAQTLLVLEATLN